MRHSVGCPACRGTGFRGRLAVAELLVIDEESRQMMGRSADRQAMLQLARRSGMNTLWEAGMQRVLDGQTSIEELAAKEELAAIRHSFPRLTRCGREARGLMAATDLASRSRTIWATSESCITASRCRR